MHKGLKKIEMSAFNDCTSLKKVVLPEGFETLEPYVFSGSGLQEITIPDSIISVRYGCFNRTPFLEKAQKDEKLVIRGPVLIDGFKASGKVTIPNRVKIIAEEAFRNNSKMTSVVVPSSVKMISHSAFYSCTALTSVTIKDGVEGIDEFAFLSCSKLTSVSLPSSVKYFGYAAFADTPWLAAQGDNGPFIIINHVLEDGTKAKGAITIPNNVKRIAKEAFLNNDNVTSITIPGTVKIIDPVATINNSIGTGLYLLLHRVI